LTAVFYNPRVLNRFNLTQKISRPWLLLILLLLLLPGFAGCSLFEETSLTITWTTESELDTIGFNLYRADSVDGEYTKINEELIPPASDPFIGGEHTFIDENVTRGNIYYYQLETVDRNGNTTRTDPINLTAGG
jgi:hypothetical protein